MQRDLEHLASTQFDVIIVGGGIYGAWTALDAAQRGLSVALVEQNDFCSATSANNHRIIHGGLRYLQHGDLRRMRESIRERSILLRIAPELVRPMPVLAPTTHHWSQHRLVMRAALLANELISADRNRELREEQRIPAAHLVSKEQCRTLAPIMKLPGTTGGAMFYDAQILSPERLVITILQRACEAGAAVANYVRATGFLRQGDRVAGIRARCMLSDDRFEIRGRSIINCLGPWANDHKGLFPPDAREHAGTFKAAVLVTRDLGLKTAIAIPGRSSYADSSEVLRKNYRNFFVTPWRGLSLIGTFYAPHEGSAADCIASEDEIASWLSAFNAACPAAALNRDDVLNTLTGLLPCGPGSTDDRPQYAKRYRIINHGRLGEGKGMDGLISIMGVKFTTARGVAERAVDMAAQILGRTARPCRTQHTLLTPELLTLDVRLAAAELQSDSAALRMAVTRAVRHEMAHRLTDVVLRRTDFAAAGPPPASCLARGAAIMAEELSWSMPRREYELQAVRALHPGRGVIHAA